MSDVITREGAKADDTARMSCDRCGRVVRRWVEVLANTTGLTVCERCARYYQRRLAVVLTKPFPPWKWGRDR
jgi:hypothetical protein